MIRTYFNQKAATWDETASERDTAKLERMVRHLNIKAGAAVLDVGTGTGVFLPFLWSGLGRGGQIIALDIAEAMLKKAKAKGFNGDIDYFNADVTSLPLRDETFDAVVCYSSFPHFQDKPGALAEIRRVLKNCGRLLICHTSSRAQINQLHSQIPTVANDLIPDQGEMQIMLSMAGFTDVSIEDNDESYLASAGKPKCGS